MPLTRPSASFSFFPPFFPSFPLILNVSATVRFLFSTLSTFYFWLQDTFTSYFPNSKKKKKKSLYLSLLLSFQDGFPSFREALIEVPACYLKRRGWKRGCLQCPQNTACLETGSTIAMKRSSTRRQPTCSYFLLLLTAEQQLQQNNPHAYQRIMHPSPLLLLLNGAHTQQAFHPLHHVLSRFLPFSSA